MKETKYSNLLHNMKQWYILFLGILVIFVSYVTLYINDLLSQNRITCSEPFPVSLYIPIFFSLGLLGGYSLYKIFTPEPKKTEEEIKDYSNIYLKLIDEELADIVRELIEKGEILQSDLSEKYGRVKAHRLIARLETKGVIIREPYGKTYKIRLKLDQ